MFNRTEQFQLITIFPIYKDSLDLSITNRFVYLVRTARFIQYLASQALQKQNTLVPSFGTLIFEQVRSFIQGMTEDQVGKEKGRSFVPLVLTVFLLILGRNVMGMIPNTFPFILRTRRYLRRNQRNKRFLPSSNLVSSKAHFLPSKVSERSRMGSRRLLWRQIQIRSILGTSSMGRGKRVTWFTQLRNYPSRTITPASSFEGVVRKMLSVGKDSSRIERKHRRRLSPRLRKRYRKRRIQRRIFRRRLTLFSTAPGRFTPTSHLGFTFRISRSLFVGLIYYSLERHGLHFFSFFFPRGIPFALAPFIVVLEMISFFFRPVSLGVRLRANMTAGHLLLHTVRGFVSNLLGRKGIMFCLLGRRGGRILEGVFLLETRVCFLQAYVFTALFTIYLKDAEALH